MDFRRIESIFLIVFIGLDIFLGLSFFQNRQVDLATTQSDNSTVINDISDDQIKLPKLSTKTPTGGYLASQGNTSLRQRVGELTDQAVTFSGSDYTTLHSLLNSPERIKQGKEVSFLKQWLQGSGNVLYGSHYSYAPGLSGGNTYVFSQKTKQGLIYDKRGQVSFTVTGDKLVSYKQTYIAKLSVLRSNVALCSEQDAIVTLYRDNELPTSSKVLWTQLAYSYLLDAKGSTVYVPTWLVGVESQGSKNVTIKRLNAITKTVTKAETD